MSCNDKCNPKKNKSGKEEMGNGGGGVLFYTGWSGQFSLIGPEEVMKWASGCLGYSFTDKGEKTRQSSWDRAYLVCWRNRKKFSLAGVRWVQSTEQRWADLGTVLGFCRDLVFYCAWAGKHWLVLYRRVMGYTTFRRIALLALLKINYSCTKMKIRPVKRLAKGHVREGEDSFMGLVIAEVIWYWINSEGWADRICW